MIDYVDESIDYSDIPPMADFNWEEGKMVLSDDACEHAVNLVDIKELITSRAEHYEENYYSENPNGDLGQVIRRSDAK